MAEYSYLVDVYHVCPHGFLGPHAAHNGKTCSVGFKLELDDRNFRTFCLKESEDGFHCGRPEKEHISDNIPHDYEPGLLVNLVVEDD